MTNEKPNTKMTIEFKLITSQSGLNDSPLLDLMQTAVANYDATLSIKYSKEQFKEAPLLEQKNTRSKK